MYTAAKMLYIYFAMLVIWC